MPSLETRCDAPVRVCITVCSCESRTRRGDFDFEWVMRVGLGGLGAWRVRVRCASWLYARCFACERDEGREREESKQESDWNEDHGRYRMRGRRVGVRGMDIACKSPALCPAPVTKTGNSAGSIVPSRCLSCPLSFRLSSVKARLVERTSADAQLMLSARVDRSPSLCRRDPRTITCVNCRSQV